jgi:hypothetical protein
MSAKAVTTVIEICLAHCQDLPTSKRILLYRGLAELCTSEAQAAELRRVALELESADRRCREFPFNQ